ncbi:global transcription factor group protein [Medicago truncatula]|uniref:Global transcription factor group protein n=1 Tax=Medicago truncatula TaxID=3880 RepID=G7KE23_MEDTR|nr:global transcription factor group protein [Medicago truncatula]
MKPGDWLHILSCQSDRISARFLMPSRSLATQLGKQVNDVEQFYQSTDVQQNDCKYKGREKPPTGSKKALKRASEDMQAEMRHNFNKIFNEASASTSAITTTTIIIIAAIAKDKWAWPFLDPVDVEGLGLYDYYQIIEKPMDFSTIKIRMEAKDGSGYKNVREIYADVRLIFKNAMKYNDEKNDVHVMAKTLLEKFENDLSKEEAHEELNKRLAQEATYANMTRELSTELSKVDMALRSLKTTAISQCRKLSHPEKLILANAFTKLSPDNIVKALEIVKESNPNFKDRIDMVTLDLDSQSDYTLFRLHMFVKNTLEVQEGTSVINHEDNIEEMKNNAKKRRIV